MATEDLEREMQAHFDEEIQRRSEAVTALNHEIYHELKSRQINVDGFDKLFFDTLSLVCSGDIEKTKQTFSEVLIKFDTESKKFGVENFSKAESDFLKGLQDLITEEK